MTSFFSAEGGSIWINFRRLQWCVGMETRCRISIWRTFGRIQWHVMPEPRITLQGAATWWIHCHDSRATCHIAEFRRSWSCHIAGCKNSIRHIENFFSPYFILLLFLMHYHHHHHHHALLNSETNAAAYIDPIGVGKVTITCNKINVFCSLGFDERRLSYRLLQIAFLFHTRTLCI